MLTVFGGASFAEGWCCASLLRCLLSARIATPTVDATPSW
jgi:hypothetical protein